MKSAQPLITRPIKTLIRKARLIQKQNPYWSTLLVFNIAVAGTGIDPLSLGAVFRSVVDPDDFDPEEREGILEYALRIASEVPGNSGS